jgi:hypothetical protein
MAFQHYDDSTIIRHALLMWRNHIQTGDIRLSAGDVHAGAGQLMGKPKKLPKLLPEQQDLIARLERLADNYGRSAKQ